MWIDFYPLTADIDFHSATTLTYLCATPRNLLSRQTSVPLWPLAVMIDRFLFGKPNPPDP